MAHKHGLLSDGLIMGSVIFVIMGWQSVSDSRAQSEKIRPVMVAAAEQGKPEAILWVFKHADNDYAKLKVAVDKGQPESMWLYSQYLRSQGDPAAADQLRDKAAEQGFVDAILDIKPSLPVTAQ
jgi:hypothetical protein